MALDVNKDFNDQDIVYDSDDLEAFFPGCVVRNELGFTMNHNRLTTRYIMAIKATTGLTKEEFLNIMAGSWDDCVVDSIERPLQ
jgi:hypothetical protein